MAKARILKPEHAGTDMESTDIWKFIFHENYPTFKVAMSGSLTLTIPSGGTEAYQDIYHSLGYTPIAFVYIRKDGRQKPVSGTLSPSEVLINTPSGPVDVKYESRSVDNNTIRVSVDINDTFETASSNESFIVNYLVMLDEF